MSWQEDRLIRQQICEIHRRLYELGFSVANDGNTSVRIDKNRALVTPRGLNKAKLEPSQIALIDLDGNLLSGSHPPSTEIFMHCEIYKVRPDVSAVIHAHPPYSIACSLARVSLEEYVLPEIVLTLGNIPTAPYATTGTKEIAKAVAESIKDRDAVILDRHGTVTVGKTLEDAMLKLERAEHTARIIAIARSMGVVTPLPSPEVEKLTRLAGTAPQHPKAEERSPGATPFDPGLVDLITKEVLSVIAQQGTKK